MSVISDKKLEKLQFAESHIANWTTNAVAIGTTAPAVSALATLTTTARAQYNAQVVAQEAARSAVGNANIAIDQMVDAASDIIRQIRAKAAVSGDGIFTLAGLPIPAPPGPVPAPGTPYNFKVELVQDGSLILRWKCNNPENGSGTIYQIARRIGPTGPFTIIGATGLRSLIDSTLPAGSVPVTYQITAIRSTVNGLPGTFTVNFGVGGEGQMMAMVQPAPKLAA